MEPNICDNSAEHSIPEAQLLPAEFIDQIADKYLDMAPQLVVILGADLVIHAVSRMGLELLGRSLEELVGRRLTDAVIKENDRPEFAASVQRVLKSEPKQPDNVTVELMGRRGETLHMLWRIIPVGSEAGQAPRVFCLAADITQQVRSQWRVEHLNRILRGVNRINQLIVTEHDKGVLMQQVCNLLVNEGEYLSAWILLVDSNGSPASSYEAGLDESFTPLRNQLMRGDFPRCVTDVLHCDEVDIITDPKQTCRTCCLCEVCGPKFAMSARLAFKDRLFGVLTVSLPREFIIEDERRLLEEAANDISMAIDRIEMEEMRLLLSAIVNRVPHPMALLSKDYVYLTVNRAYYGFFKVPPDEIVGSRVTDFIDNNTFESDIKPHLDACLAGEHVSYELTVDFRGKGDRWMQMDYHPYRDNNDEIVGVISHGFDITEQKQADLNLMASEQQMRALNQQLVAGELQLKALNQQLLASNQQLLASEQQLRANNEQLLASEAKYRLYFERAPVGYQSLDSDGVFIDVNSYWLRELGYEKNEVIGKWFGDFLPTDESAAFRETFKQTINADDEVEGMIYHLRKKDGAYIIAAFTASVSRDAQGDFLRTHCVFRNITERVRSRNELNEKKEALERELDKTEKQRIANLVLLHDVTEKTQQLEKTGAKLEESETKYRMLAETAEDIIMLHDIHGVIKYVNRAGAEFTGRSVEELVGDNVLNFVPKSELDQVRSNAVMRRVNKDKFNIYELSLRNCHGEMIPFEVRSTIADDNGQDRNILLIARNISNRKKAEEEHMKLLGRLNQTQKMEAIGRLAGGVAHDFNNMLSVIIGSVDLAKTSVDLNSEINDNLDEIRNAAERSAELTKQLLAFARKQNITPQKIDINPMIGRMLKMLQRLVGEHIELVWRPDDSVRCVVIDPAQINQLMANLVVNARDAIGGDAGMVSIETSRAIVGETYCKERPEAKPGDFTVISVSDNGCGMDADTLEKIYEPFFTTKRAGEGTGMGLATVFGIVKQNGGFISTYSEPGKGSTFRLYLVSAEKEEIVDKVAAKPMKALRGVETVLLVEDERTLLIMISRMLQSLGYTVFEANNPTEAIAISRQNEGKIDLLVTDVVMPVMNGHELAMAIEPLQQSMKVLYMSGYTADVIAQHGVIDEGVNLIIKPFMKDELSITVRRVLDN